MKYSDSSLEIKEILTNKNLLALYQPIVDISRSEIFAHEALIRGPVESKLHSPIALFNAARLNGLNAEMEYLARNIVLAGYAQSAKHTKLFINVSPECLLIDDVNLELGLTQLDAYGLSARNIVIEITEGSSIRDYAYLREAILKYKSLGFGIALDDLGEGYSSLRLWSELSPDYVKIDKHFIANIHNEPMKLEFVRAIQKIATESGSLTIAEGIETREELSVIKDLKINYGQGYLFGRPFPKFQIVLADEIKMLLNKSTIHVFVDGHNANSKQATVSNLVSYQAAVTSAATNEEVYDLFHQNASLNSVPVVDDDIPIGLISRYNTIDRFARRYQKELHGKKSCINFMDNQPLIVQKNMTIHALSELILAADPKYLLNGFIVVDGQEYIGMGSGHALLREVTNLQIHAARYANPLTLLPGNVPINAHVDRLLDNNLPFVACYCDLDNFKPFNDAYGYRRGDEVIQFIGSLLSSALNSEADFVGHIGGDDFVLLFQSENWETLCQDILNTVEIVMPDFYDKKDVELGGINVEDRMGNVLFYPFGSLSIGAVKVQPEFFKSHHEVAGAMSAAKKQAKNMIGNSLFLDRRKTHGKAYNKCSNAA
jgi:EAL domain-containing protein (putative c-di-GMP-specific phosphodiesterase class I)/GGDEF domain-containing protein/predicted transcriptional regulator